MEKTQGKAPEKIVTAAKEEAKEAPSRLRKKLCELETMWERANIQFFQAAKLYGNAIVLLKVATHVGGCPEQNEVALRRRIMSILAVAAMLCFGKMPRR